MLLWYSQQSRVTETPSMTFVDGPSTHRGGEATLQRPPSARVGHWLFHVSVAVAVVAGLVYVSFICGMGPYAGFGAHPTTSRVELALQNGLLNIPVVSVAWMSPQGA